MEGSAKWPSCRLQGQTTKCVNTKTKQFTLDLRGHDSIADRITIQFQLLRLEEGLRLILDGQSYAVEYARGPGGGGREVARVPKGLWIFSNGKHSRPHSGPVGNIGEPSLKDASIDIPRVRAVLESAEDSWVKEDAIVDVVESVDPGSAVPLVRLGLLDRDEEVRLAAIEALVILGGIGAAEALEIALRDEESWIREKAIEALEQIGEDRAAQSLTIALHDQDTDVRHLAVDALGAIGSPTAFQLLEYAWAADGDESVREAAAALLEKLSHRDR